MPVNFEFSINKITVGDLETIYEETGKGLDEIENEDLPMHQRVDALAVAYSLQRGRLDSDWESTNWRGVELGQLLDSIKTVSLAEDGTDPLPEKST